MTTLEIANERSAIPPCDNGDRVTSRAKRKLIRDIPAYTISADGIPRKWGRKMEIGIGPGGLPVVIVQGLELFLDEIVAHAFLGAPPLNIRGMDVEHFDGDMWNCRVDNIAWWVRPEYVAWQRERDTKRNMWPDHLPVNPRRIPKRGMSMSRQHRMFLC